MRRERRARPRERGIALAVVARMTWTPLEITPADLGAPGAPTIEVITDRVRPAIIVRGAYPPELCQEAVDRVLPLALETSTPGHVRLGPVFGWLKHVPDSYLQLSEMAGPLFESIFDDIPNPVDVLYATLRGLMPHKDVRTAAQPDGRTYAPAIFRAFAEGAGHHAHVDNVHAFREFHPWSVTDYAQQLSMVMCLQNSEIPIRPVIYDQMSSPEVLHHIDHQSYPGYADAHGVPRTAIHLEPGDLYVFWAAHVHEVPLIKGDGYRVICAAFAGFDRDRSDVVVWA
jgi:hypothetical protein